MAEILNGKEVSKKVKDELKIEVEKLKKNGLDNNYAIFSNRKDIPKLLKVMDAFVFPSLYEGLPLSLIEAQVSKLPCFVSDRIPEQATISNLVTRLSLDRTPKKWAEVILNYQKPKRIVVNDSEWDIREITKQLEQIYLDEIEKRQDGEK